MSWEIVEDPRFLEDERIRRQVSANRSELFGPDQFGHYLRFLFEQFGTQLRLAMTRPARMSAADFFIISRNWDRLIFFEMRFSISVYSNGLAHD